MRGSATRLGLFVVVAAVVACGGDEPSLITTSSGNGAGATVGNGSGGSDAGGSDPGTGGSVTAGSGGSGSGGMGVGGGCPASALGPGDSDHVIEHDGLTRSYHLRVPPGYDNSSAIPLVFDIHGLASNATQQRFISGWEAVADAQGLAVVWPEGSGSFQSWNGGDTCCGEALASNRDDVGLMRAIVAEVSSQLCVDPKRIYATGLSNGGALSHRLACDAADLFAAVAPVSYPIAYLPISKCSPSRPIAVMHFHGTGDTTVPYGGGLGIASAQESFAQWASNDGCSGGPGETYAKGSSHCDSHTTCQAGVEATLCTLNGPHLLYSNADAVPIAQLAWDFFAQHALP
ncbi:MAG: hypothetical protein KC731_12265 [Myxococcales bacterium]|nr:hypothetical protein [Myxococcales bacterium]